MSLSSHLKREEVSKVLGCRNIHVGSLTVTAAKHGEVDAVKITLAIVQPSNEFSRVVCFENVSP